MLRAARSQCVQVFHPPEQGTRGHGETKHVGGDSDCIAVSTKLRGDVGEDRHMVIVLGVAWKEASAYWARRARAGAPRS